MPIVYDLLGVPDPDEPSASVDSDALQRRAFAAVRAVVAADGRRPTPSIVFVEDLHWLDAASDAYLAQIVAATSASRVLTLVNLRPEYRAAWMQTASYRQLPLAALLRALEGLPARASIESRLAETLRGTDRTAAERWRPHVHLEQAELHRLSGDLDAAAVELAEVARLFAAMGAAAAFAPGLA